MKKLFALLSVAAITLGLISCGVKETKSVFDGYSLGMSQSEIINKLGEPSVSFEPSGVGGFDIGELYEDTNVPYFGMNGYFYFKYSNKDNPVLTSMSWIMTDDIIEFSEKQSEIDGIIALYDNLYGEHSTHLLKEDLELFETTVYEWKDSLGSTISLRLEMYVDSASIVLEMSKY